MTLEGWLLGRVVHAVGARAILVRATEAFAGRVSVAVIWRLLRWVIHAVGAGAVRVGLASRKVPESLLCLGSMAKEGRVLGWIIHAI